MRRGAVALAALGLLATVSGCGSSSSSGPPAPSASKLVASTTARTAAQKSFHFLFDEQHPPPNRPGITITHADGDVVIPGSVKADVAGTFSGIPLATKLITLPAGQYIQAPFSGNWQKIDTSVNSFAFFDPRRGVLAVLRSARDPRNAGSERVDGVDAWRVHATVSRTALSFLFRNPPGNGQVGVDLWIGKEDGLLHRIDLVGPLTDYEAKSIVRSIRLSHFGEPVTIEPPAGAS
jgi:hypothetical protein